MQPQQTHQWVLPMDPRNPLPIGSSQSTYPVKEIQQMALHRASIPPPNLHSRASKFPMTSPTSSSTSTTCAVANLASSINFYSIQPLPSVLISQNNQPPFTSANNSSSQPLIPPYLANLTPRPSVFCPHCPEKDRLAPLQSTPI